jgi:hypothetical protein
MQARGGAMIKSDTRLLASGELAEIPYKNNITIIIRPGTFTGYVAIIPYRHGDGRKKIQAETYDGVVEAAKKFIDDGGGN